GPDFYIYHASSLQLLRSGPGSAYDLALQKQFQDQVTAQWGGAYVLLPQILPPWVTLAFYPLGLLPFRAAYLAWGATILVLVAAAILVLVRAAGLRGRSAVLASAAAAASLPLFVLLVQGQSDAPMLLALAAAGLAWVRRRPAWAGAFAALALVKPQLMVLVPALFLVRRSWPALGAFAGVAAGLALVSLLVFGLRACLGAALRAGGWLALELLIMAPAVTALAIVALTVFLAWECWGDRPAPVSEPNALPLAA